MATLLGYPLAGRKKHSTRFNALVLLMAAAAMIAASVIELIPAALAIDSGWADSALWLFVGFGVFVLIKLVSSLLQKHAAGLVGSTTVVTIALTLHNIPEGTAAVAAASTDLTTGIHTGIAIALQNIPEGLSIAALAFAAGSSRRWTFGLVAVSAIAEVLGAAGVWVNREVLSPEINSHMLLAVAAIMLAISFIELIPDGIRLLQLNGKTPKTPIIPTNK
ncbi:ZIP family metal transporter [Rhodoluna limnophila]|uniref:ZIP family metal transporter n=1 Tax=Rhodoluna limnophila TaxID=232537 RepID=UPI00110611A9|nr:ZIP family metal transporter [Rhodoluna limnophila]